MSTLATLAQLEEVRTVADRADRTAKIAADRELDVYQQLGNVTQELSNIAGKVDALIDSQRKTHVQVAALRKEFAEQRRTTSGALASMRPKMASVKDLEEELDDVAAKVERDEKRRASIVKWARRVALAVVLGAATTAGAAAVASALHSCGINLPLEIKP